jgi:hypothetical protein
VRPFERSYAVNRLDKIGECPRTRGVRRRKSQLSVRGITRVFDGGGFSIVK